MLCYSQAVFERRPLFANLLALGLFLTILTVFALAGQALGREPGPPWMCDDTRYTQLVPRGLAVVGPPASPPPGCGP
jgi:hypothetical protein